MGIFELPHKRRSPVVRTLGFVVFYPAALLLWGHIFGPETPVFRKFVRSSG